MKTNRLELSFRTKLSVRVEVPRTAPALLAMKESRKRIEAFAKKELQRLREDYHVDAEPRCTGS